VTGGTRRVMTWTVRSTTHKPTPTSTFTAPSVARTTTATKTSCRARRRSTRHHNSERQERPLHRVLDFRMQMTSLVNIFIDFATIPLICFLSKHNEIYKMIVICVDLSKLRSQQCIAKILTV